MSTTAIIWDVDGTLVDTADHHFRAWAQFAVEIGRPFTREDFAATFGQRNPEIIRQLFYPDATDELCDQLGDRKETFYREAVGQEGTALLPGAAALLAAFAEAGWPQAVGSSAPQANLELLLAVTDTARYFRAVVSGDDVRNGKPNPEVFLTAAARLGAEPGRCVVFEDAVAGVQAAKTGGMKCVAVTFVGHHPPEALRAAGADLVVPTLDALSIDQVRELVNA